MKSVTHEHRKEEELQQLKGMIYLCVKQNAIVAHQSRNTCRKTI